MHNRGETRVSVKLPNYGPTLLLTVDETAREMRIARRRVWEMISDGTLPSVKIGRSRRISRQAIEDYVSKLQAPA